MLKTITTMATMIAMWSVFANNLMLPVDYPTAQVMPKGFKSIQYNKVIMEDKTVTLGQLPMGKPMPRPMQRRMMKIVKPKVNIDTTMHVIKIAYGITDEFTLAVATPILEANVNIGPVPGMINKKLSGYGYAPLASESFKRIGDIRIAGKYLVLEDNKQALILRPEIILPTGKEKDIKKVISIPTGDGQFDIGFGGIYQRYLLDKVLLVADTSYMIQLPDKRSERIREKENFMLSEDIDMNTKRDLGDIFKTSLGIQYEPCAGAALYSSYGYQHKQKDEYKGNAFAAKRYEWNSLDTDQYMHTLQMGVSYNAAKRFSIPIKIGVNHSRVLDSKNTSKDPLTSFSFTMMF